MVETAHSRGKLAATQRREKGLQAGSTAAEGRDWGVRAHPGRKAADCFAALIVMTMGVKILQSSRMMQTAETALPKGSRPKKEETLARRKAKYQGSRYIGAQKYCLVVARDCQIQKIPRIIKVHVSDRASAARPGQSYRQASARLQW